MTSVAQRMPAATAARDGTRLSVVMASTAFGKRSPVALWRVLRTPIPSGFVSESGTPACPASMRSSSRASAKPVTASPYFWFGVVDAVPAGEVATCCPGDVEASAQHFGGNVEVEERRGASTAGYRHQWQATDRVDVGYRVRCSDPSPVVGVVDDGCEKSLSSEQEHGFPRLGPRPRRHRRLGQ